MFVSARSAITSVRAALFFGLILLSGCAGVTRRASIVTPGRPTGGTDFDFDQLPLYQADAAVYREAVEGNISAATAAAVAGAPCPAAPSAAGAATQLAFCTMNGVLVVQVRDANGNPVGAATNPISIGS